MTHDLPAGCRSCRSTEVVTVLELADQPVADDLVDSHEDALRSPRHRLAIGCCGTCGLVQLDPATPVLANAAHGHGSFFSGTVLQHEAGWARDLIALLPGDRPGRILDVGSGGGGLLSAFRAAGHAVQGWERDDRLAAEATADGIPTTSRDGTLGGPTEPLYDLVIVNHTLSHADDLDAAVSVLARSLAHGGTVAIEFHHALGILTESQFDVVCHAHRSYLSLTALAAALRRHGLTVQTATRLPLHGGVVRLLASAAPAPAAGPDVQALLAEESRAGLADPGAWAAVAEQAESVRRQIRATLDSLSPGTTVAGYGAPSRGTTLLNHCALTCTDLPRTADRSPAKQGRFLPGVGTRVCAPDELTADPPDVVVVLVWPLRDEVLTQLSDLRKRGTRFLFPLPRVEVVP